MTRAEYLVGVQTQNEDFVYDKLGNRTTLKHNGTDVARYQHNDVNEYTYIGLGSGTNVTHDNAGNMTGDHDGYTYHYDYENRLTRVKKLSDTVDVAVYTYDALGRRIEKIEYASPSNITTRYYYDGWRVLSETDDNDDWLRDYDYGNYIDEVLVMTDTSDDHYFAHDHLFSVVALIDEDGDILERYEYDAYGKCHFYDSSFTLLGTQKSGHGNDRLFTGQMLDILDGGALSLEYFKNRYKKDGRFITRDPLGVRDGNCIITFRESGEPIFPRRHLVHDQYKDGMNLYEYVLSNPCNNTDTEGLYNYYAQQAGIPTRTSIHYFWDKKKNCIKVVHVYGHGIPNKNKKGEITSSTQYLNDNRTLFNTRLHIPSEQLCCNARIMLQGCWMGLDRTSLRLMACNISKRTPHAYGGVFVCACTGEYKTTWYLELSADLSLGYCDGDIVCEGCKK